MLIYYNLSKIMKVTKLDTLSKGEKRVNGKTKEL